MAKKEENIRKRANDYRKEYTDISEKKKSIKARIRERTLNLCKRYPDVVLDEINGTKYTAGTMITLLPKNAFNVNRMLEFMQIIEEHIDSLHPHQQQKMF